MQKVMKRVGFRPNLTARQLRSRRSTTVGLVTFATGYYGPSQALGVIQAMEEAGIKPGVDIKIVSIDGVKGAFEAMKEGKLNVTVECNPLLGPQLFDLVEATAAKKEVPKRVVTQEGVFEQSQAAAELPKRQY